MGRKTKAEIERLEKIEKDRQEQIRQEQNKIFALFCGAHQNGEGKWYCVPLQQSGYYHDLASMKFTTDFSVMFEVLKRIKGMTIADYDGVSTNDLQDAISGCLMSLVTLNHATITKHALAFIEWHYKQARWIDGRDDDFVKIKKLVLPD